MVLVSVFGRISNQVIKNEKCIYEIAKVKDHSFPTQPKVEKKIEHRLF